MAAKKNEPNQKTIDVLQIQRGSVEFCVLGVTPTIQNRMSEKAKRELLFPIGHKTRAMRAANLKHNPIEEFRASAYRVRDPKSPTNVIIPCGAFKKAMACAALDLPGSANKSQIGRLVNIVERDIQLYGVPQLFMAVTRCADMSHTPDIRTRAIFPEWACRVRVTFPVPVLNAKVIANLMAAAGMIQGIGDWRTQKGSGDFGSFELVDATDKRFRKVIENGGREAQMAAFENPECYDDETESLLSWFVQEVEHRKGEKPGEKPDEEAA